jgi:hypothetical protein
VGVSAIRRVRGRGGHRASRSGRRASNASKSQTKTARSRSIWDDVPLGERVEGSPSRRPVRVRDAVQVALYAGQERRGVRGVAHRARPPARDPKLPARRTSPIGNNEVPRRLVAKKAFPRAEVWIWAKSVRRRAPRRRTHFSTRGARADGSRLERGGRESGRGGNGVFRLCLRRTRRGRLREIVDER